MERDIPRKSRGPVRKGERTEPRRGYAFMKAHRATFPLAVICRVPGLSPGGCNGRLWRPLSARARRDAELKGGVLAIQIGSGGFQNARRLHSARGHTSPANLEKLNHAA